MTSVPRKLWRKTEEPLDPGPREARAEGNMNMVKQRLQMLNSPYRGVWECARGVYRAEGFRAFYRSYGTQVAMNVPFQAVHLVTYEWVQGILNPRRSYEPRAHLAAGALAGALAAAATTPLDVCKTVLNTQEGSARADGLAAAAALVLRAGGLRAFFRGVRARVLYQMPAAAICWLTYETLKHALLTFDLEESGGCAGAAGRPRSPRPAAGGPLACAALRLAAADVPGPLTRT
ncbi:mitoferrin-1 like protein [Danaus plexippus plexippus]|uniref:Mitoferrin-1 like protein n=1 Tax=Danaus plexippus plexippus TaxID=278856 RepID=A0A212FEE6_DANPL|nr:mitoferrin-1 like protein [Danaus plexippus plexippus]